MSLELKLLSFENPVFRGYFTHAAILVLKMMIMAILTARQRIKHRVYPSPEDIKCLKALRGSKGIVNRHEEVERVRKAHRNDLENIPIFFVAALGYLLTNPNPVIALNLFRLFTVCRCAFTFVYAIYVVPQPARVIAWFGAYCVTGYMALQAILYFGTF